MPETFFCADASKCVQEDIIGTGTNYQTYILIECCLPWESEAFDSKQVPQNLRDLVEEVEHSKQKIRFLLINSDQTKCADQRKVLIYDNKSQALFEGYEKYEFNASNIEQVAAIVKSYLAGEVPDCEVENNPSRDILVCTHGSHDRCCARYGNPFYAQATALVSELELSDVRLWKSSHFGGHRMAPTAIDLRDGRYYGNLDRISFKSILTRSGDIECLNQVYRGWGILPNQIQVLEREFIIRYGWDWFNYKVSGCIVDKNPENDDFVAELTFENVDGTYIYRAELVKDEAKTVRLKGSCGAKQESEFVKYLVKYSYFYSKKEESRFVIYPFRDFRRDKTAVETASTQTMSASAD
ncbi:MAG: sucrase ferredoxin [Microcoleus sp. PH2017_25_DOB_D_A]|uniref:sucrase ferredoxin n=1 Tax=unclassified Microcoleus TaxID=2642155 RepID=UPI001D9D9C98|nr:MULTISPECIES: sucrase ferredoxin [unclassified Microcoleus]MCC3467574.1 sucrase ferredoxin [Microcoleus sp. PH2017_06_SFM_O_A]TAE37605.1 MAG: sucrase ferredoxin [Oscillatoriales cyanobacterium]MCC3537870.1 sucrase ferredoxin [Microcoleus sp. PH2017_25_DOB_D_A]MCC3550257.1 sucrase ferredoxin [Microcoleus sp. PH2017_24_DOB_U_A]MCC3569226.1 sucrase ferredoxin [Microcoleus sp. PH2017_31_RDM_U_A]